jgi:hypothetical protein
VKTKGEKCQMASVGPGDESGNERTGKRQVGRVVAEQQPRGDARRQWDAEGSGKDQALGPVPLLGQQDLPKPPESNQHRRQHGDNGQLRHQRGQQVLGGKETRDLGHGATRFWRWYPDSALVLPFRIP